jgi:nucleotide-binding universal stress UspA family protein
MPNEHLTAVEKRHSEHPPFARILCAVDGGRHSTSAIDQAIAVAGDDARIVFAASDALGPAVLVPAAKRAREAGTEFSERVLPAQPLGEALVRQSATCDLVVVGAHPEPRSSGLVLDETAALLVRRSRVPVLIARPRELVAGVIAATSGRPADRAALTAGAHLAARLGAELTVVHVAEPEDHDRRHELASELTNARALLGRDLQFVTRRGATALRIIELAEDSGAGLIVLGGADVHRPEPMSSVSERVAHTAPCSVLILPGS